MIYAYKQDGCRHAVKAKQNEVLEESSLARF